MSDDATISHFPEDWPADPLATHGAGKSTAPLDFGDFPKPAFRPLNEWSLGSRTEDSRTPGPHEGQPGYLLLKEVGRGGHGEVWEAIQTSLGRVVALKRARRDLLDYHDPTTARARSFQIGFRQEAQVMASLEHPNIVPIHDLGEDDSGHPLLAMKLVNGTPWYEMLFNDFSSLPVDEYHTKHVQILIAVTQAVAFAHSRNIVHRDIKPSQVMVGEYGEVLLMDWGLAMTVEPEARNSHSTVEDLYASSAPATISANPAGTAAYMAPEQTEDSTEQVGRHTDIFLLGATLYAVLTGTPPHQSSDSKRAFAKAILCEIQPPATREPNRRLPPELCELCMKAMARNPSERIQSAREFLIRLQNYLSGVGARRTSMSLLEGAQSDLLVAKDYDDFGSAIAKLDQARTLWNGNVKAEELLDQAVAAYARRALENGDLALAKAQADRIKLDSARGDLRQQIEARRIDRHRQVSQRKAAIAIAAVALLALVVGGAKHLHDVRREKDRADVARQEAVVARAEAEDLLDFMLLDLHKKLGERGSLELLEEPATKALSYFRELSPSEVTPESMRQRALALSNIADVLGARGDATEARAALEESLSIFQTLSEQNPDSVNRRRDVSVAIERIAKLDMQQGRHKEALKKYEQVLKIRQALNNEGPGSGQLTQNVIVAWENVGSARLALRDQSGAMEAFEKRLQLAQEVLAEEPENPYRQAGVASALLDIADIQEEFKDLDAALISHLQAFEIRRKLASQFPENAQMARALTVSQTRIGALYQKQGEWEDALDWLTQTIPVREKAIIDDPNNLMNKQDLAVSLSRIATAQLELEREDEAVLSLERAIELREDIVSIDSTNDMWRNDLANNYRLQSSIARRRGDYFEAYDLECERVGLMEILARESPDSPIRLNDLAIAYFGLAWMSETTGNPAEAALLYSKGEDGLLELLTRNPADLTAKQNLMEALRLRADLRLRMGQPEEAAMAMRQRIQLGESLNQAGISWSPSNHDFRFLGESLMASGEREQGLNYLLRALAISEAEAADQPESQAVEMNAAWNRVVAGNGLIKAGDRQSAGELLRLNDETFAKWPESMENLSALDTWFTTLLLLDRRDEAMALLPKLVEMNWVELVAPTNEIATQILEEWGVLENGELRNSP